MLWLGLANKRGVRIGECVYCGEPGPLTNDHVPPKNLFAKPRPSNLVTVPSCRKCNKSFELDDEYFRLAITTGIDPISFPNEFDLSVNAIRKLRDPRKIGFRKSMLASFSKKPQYTPAGLYLGQAGVLEIDVARVQNVVSRIIRGLFFVHSGRRLPSTSRVWVLSDWFGGDYGSDAEFVASLQEILAALDTEQVREIGERVFRYRYRLGDDGLDQSIWEFSFYAHRHFVGATEGPSEGCSDGEKVH
jgi:hypothetical protein